MPLPTSPGLSTALSTFPDSDDDPEKEWEAILADDPDFSHLARCLEVLVEQGRTAVESTAQETGIGGPRVVTRFVEAEATPDDSLALDESMISQDGTPSPLLLRAGMDINVRGRVSSMTSTAANESTSVESPTITRTVDRSVQVQSDHLADVSFGSEMSEPEAWSSGINSPAVSRMPSRSVSSQATPQVSFPPSPKLLDTPKLPSTAQHGSYHPEEGDLIPPKSPTAFAALGSFLGFHT